MISNQNFRLRVFDSYFHLQWYCKNFPYLNGCQKWLIFELVTRVIMAAFNPYLDYWFNSWAYPPLTIFLYFAVCFDVWANDRFDSPVYKFNDRWHSRLFRPLFIGFVHWKMKTCLRLFRKILSLDSSFLTCWHWSTLKTDIHDWKNVVMADSMLWCFDWFI
jgi:hypothetical protein